MELEDLNLAEASSTNTALYFNQTYIPDLDTLAGFSGHGASRLSRDFGTIRIGFTNLYMVGAASESMAPEAQSQLAIFDPNGPGMGLDLDFSDFNVDQSHDVSNFGFNNIINFDNFTGNLGGSMNYSNTLNSRMCLTKKPNYC